LGPETAHSPNADDINALYWVMVVVVGAILVTVNGALIGLVVRYRRARGSEPRRVRSRGPAQLATAATFTVAAVAILAAGVIFTESARDVEPSGPDGLQAAALTTAQRDLKIPTGDDVPEPLVVKASGQQWIWRYEYEDGTFSYYDLVVPVDTAVVVEVESTDVVHRWWVPGLSAKVDAVPGSVNRTWFKADEEGSFDGASYAFSGAGYATMRTRVRVESVTGYESWLERQADDIAAAQAAVQEEIAAGGPAGEEGS
jgi:heme/copper-type cytochrome/quinol oxidase subunit 2